LNQFSNLSSISPSSSSKTDTSTRCKESYFEQINTRFGRKATYVVIGDGRDKELAAKQLSWPFWRINQHQHLTALHNVLDLQFL
ncbi:unnamed protein product, partial [Didymodactylos carnosus]